MLQSSMTKPQTLQRAGLTRVFHHSHAWNRVYAFVILKQRSRHYKLRYISIY